jgi:hypothetical protein
MLHLHIVNAFDMNGNLGVLFIDIKSAFDNVLANVLIERLQTINLPRKLSAFIYNLISNRYLSFRFDTVDVTRVVYRGVTQDSVLSPTLFALHMSCLDKNVHDCTVPPFPDDIVIYHSDNEPRNISKTVSKEIGKMNAFLEKSGLEMAPDKCKFCLFSKTRK